MAKQRAKRHSGDWRLRREGYLRASGRKKDLVIEGFEQAPSTASWTVIAGGRTSLLTNSSPRTGLFLVKKLVS